MPAPPRDGDGPVSPPDEAPSRDRDESDPDRPADSGLPDRRDRQRRDGTAPRRPVHPALQRLDTPLLRRLARPGPALLLVTVAALLVRLYALGWRVMHQDEARVAHWILQYAETGTWSYRPIIHGPFLPHANAPVFEAIGPSDFAARLVVALVGGLLPLAAWLLRDHLRDAEVVALGLFLAFNPVLLYYSRFMRNDVPLAAAMLVAVAFFVRTAETGKARHLFAGTAALALGFTMKENALVYPVAWLGALALVVDHRLLLARDEGDDWVMRLWWYVRRTAGRLWAWKLPLVVATVEFAAIVVAFYAPKPDLWQALGEPSRLPGVLDAAVFGSWSQLSDMWVNSGMQDHPYLTYLGPYLEVMALAALPLSLLAVAGFLYERYATDRPRPVVSFAFYWGVASVLGYPLIVDIRAAWTVAHAVVPLAVPAAVGLALVYRLARSSYAADDGVATTLAVAILLVVAGGVGVVAYETSYRNPQGPNNPVVQYAQPSGLMQPTLARIDEVAAANDGVDVVFYGEEFYNPEQDCLAAGASSDDGGGFEDASPATDRECVETAPAGQGWFDRLPLPWYLALSDATVASTNDSAAVAERRPPVVVALGPGQGEYNSADLDRVLTGYDRAVYEQYQYDRAMVVYVRDGSGTA